MLREAAAAEGVSMARYVRSAIYHRMTTRTVESRPDQGASLDDLDHHQRVP